MGLHSNRHPPGAVVARVLLASVFLVMGAYRLWGAWQGVPTTGATLTFSALEVVLGLLLASGWQLRAVAALSALLMLSDALLSHRFWNLAGAGQSEQLLHFMKNVGLVGGLVLLATLAPQRRRR
jgi:putative oxidoreductase